MLLIIAYLITAITAFNNKSDNKTCKDIELIIKDSINAGFITERKIASLLKDEGIILWEKRWKESRQDNWRQSLQSIR